MTVSLQKLPQQMQYEIFNFLGWKEIKKNHLTSISKSLHAFIFNYVITDPLTPGSWKHLPIALQTRVFSFVGNREIENNELPRTSKGIYAATEEVRHDIVQRQLKFAFYRTALPRFDRWQNARTNQERIMFIRKLNFSLFSQQAQQATEDAQLDALPKAGDCEQEFLRTALRLKDLSAQRSVFIEGCITEPSIHFAAEQRQIETTTRMLQIASIDVLGSVLASAIAPADTANLEFLITCGLKISIPMIAWVLDRYNAWTLQHMSEHGGLNSLLNRLDHNEFIDLFNTVTSHDAAIFLIKYAFESRNFSRSDILEAINNGTNQQVLTDGLRELDHDHLLSQLDRINPIIGPSRRDQLRNLTGQIRQQSPFSGKACIALLLIAIAGFGLGTNGSYEAPRIAYVVQHMTLGDLAFLLNLCTVVIGLAKLGRL